MRILLCCLIVVVASTTIAPTSQELRSRHGAPDSEHRDGNGVPDSASFSLQSGISLTAHYGSDHHACELEVAAALDLKKSIQYPYSSAATVSEILEELAPVATRGREFGEGTKHPILVTKYENVLIEQTQNTWGVTDIKIA
jgi:hypothetical protein